MPSHAAARDQTPAPRSVDLCAGPDSFPAVAYRAIVAWDCAATRQPHRQAHQPVPWGQSPARVLVRRPGYSRGGDHHAVIPARPSTRLVLDTASRPPQAELLGKGQVRRRSIFANDQKLSPHPVPSLKDAFLATGTLFFA